MVSGESKQGSLEGLTKPLGPLRLPVQLWSEHIKEFDDFVAALMLDSYRRKAMSAKETACAVKAVCFTIDEVMTQEAEFELFHRALETTVET